MGGSWEVYLCLLIIGKFSFLVYMTCLIDLDSGINGMVGVSAYMGVSFLAKSG